MPRLRNYLIRMRRLETAYRRVSTTCLNAASRQDAEDMARKLWRGCVVLPPINRKPK